MKLRHLLLVAFALVVPAQFASASPVDPTVIINKILGGDAITFSTNSVTNPLVITLNSQGLLPQEDLDYTGTKTLTNFSIALADSLPFEEFDCQSNVFTGCKFVSTVGTPFSNDVEIEFLGPLTPGLFSIEVTPTPEPGTIVLLLTGGVLLAGLGLGRRS
ncbi:MAG TPA: PEP-CTERM sorting domain-containing protein [Candidatus Acidoferrales bacterium]|nr:PEP-CTERM sorting domain-containing protein [Candidatus Acidoferrales bacterium]